MATLTLRLPASLKARIQRLSEEEGLSMDQVVALAIAEKATLLETGHAPRDDWQAALMNTWADEGRALAAEQDETPHAWLRARLDRAPGVAPPEENRLPGDERPP